MCMYICMDVCIYIYMHMYVYTKVGKPYTIHQLRLGKENLGLTRSIRICVHTHTHTHMYIYICVCVSVWWHWPTLTLARLGSHTRVTNYGTQRMRIYKGIDRSINRSTCMYI